MPFNGTGVEPADPYVMRSHFCACFAYGGPCNDPNFDFAGRNRVAREWREVADNFVRGDYYPLTDYSIAANVWMAWQFNRPDAGHGVVQAFRRSESPGNASLLKLRGLNPSATYEIHRSDIEGVTRAGRGELTETGLKVSLPQRASAATVQYRRIP